MGKNMSEISVLYSAAVLVLSSESITSHGLFSAAEAALDNTASRTVTLPRFIFLLWPVPDKAKFANLDK
jgi:hypothetical protein